MLISGLESFFIVPSKSLQHSPCKIIIQPRWFCHCIQRKSFHGFSSFRRHPRKMLLVTMGCTSCSEDTGRKPLLLVTDIPTTASPPPCISREGARAHLPANISLGMEHRLLGTLHKGNVILPTPIPDPSYMKLCLKCVLKPQTFTGIMYGVCHGGTVRLV